MQNALNLQHVVTKGEGEEEGEDYTWEGRSESDMDNGADWQIAAARNLLLHRRQCVANIA